MPRFITRDGDAVFYRKLGTGSPIIMLHGFGMHSGHWFPYAWILALKHTVILPDWRGFGRSHNIRFNQRCTISNYADDLYDLVNHLEYEEYKLAGISMGALSALKFLEKYKDKPPSRYLHIDQSPCCTNDADWEWGLFGAEQRARLARAETLIDALEEYLDAGTEFEKLPAHLRKQVHYELSDFFATALSKPTQKRLAKKLLRKELIAKRFLPTEHWANYMQCLVSYLREDYDLRHDLAACTVPVDIMVGMKSEMYPAAGQLRMADYLPNSKVIPMVNSGHAPLIDQPIKFSQALMEFGAA